MKMPSESYPPRMHFVSIQERLAIYDIYIYDRQKCVCGQVLKIKSINEINAIILLSANSAGSILTAKDCKRHM